MEPDSSTTQDDSPNQKGAQDLNVAFALGEVHGQLAVFMATTKDGLDGIRSDLAARGTGQDAKNKALEDRVAFLEKWQYRISGFAALGGTIIGWAVQYVSRHGL